MFVAGPRSVTRVQASSSSSHPTASTSSTIPQLEGYEDRVAGALVGAMCGNALGLPMEPERHYRITRLFPHGLTNFWQFDISNQPVAPGHVSGDLVTMLATARSLITAGRANMYDLIEALTSSYSPETRRYTPYTQLTLNALAQGANPFSLAVQADDFLDLTTSRLAESSSDRPDRQPFGASDFGAAVRYEAWKMMLCRLGFWTLQHDMLVAMSA